MLTVGDADGGFEVEVDGLTLDDRKPYLLNAVCADINGRLGVWAQPESAPRELAVTLAGVVDRAHLHPIWTQNIDETKADLS